MSKSVKLPDYVAEQQKTFGRIADALLISAEQHRSAIAHLTRCLREADERLATAAEQRTKSYRVGGKIVLPPWPDSARPADYRPHCLVCQLSKVWRKAFVKRR